jgi:hypothetical protein
MLQDPHRGHDERNQRWGRRARADLCARYGALQAPGGSQRQAAQVLAVPRSTLPAWRTSQARLEAWPLFTACPVSPSGIAWSLLSLWCVLRLAPAGCAWWVSCWS